ncbi:zinc finger protein 175-like [Thrips palmi]|uniref:Zinc finger protein 175-like n=1 Tax=Thrips palmi TaxID=161013 RepID=A0A6P8YY51_THRPL|nr:zinc finger protein 175-like [Thrips palmi]
MDSTELCRLCATEKDTFVDGFVRIYSDEGQKFGLEKKIIRCLQIELCSADTLPKSVCLECCSKLHQCADFVESSARAQARLKIMVEHTLKSTISNDSDAKENAKTEASDAQEQIDEDKDDDPSKYLECVVNEDSSRSAPSPVASPLPEPVLTEPSHTEPSQTGSPPKDQDVSSELPRSRASKRKCRLPVRVSRVCLEDLDNVDLDAAEISKIFADDDSDEEETRRKRKSRKKRIASKASKKKSSKHKSKKPDKIDCDENVNNSGKNGIEKPHLQESENGSKSEEEGDVDEDGDHFDENGMEDDEEEEEECDLGSMKSKAKGKTRSRKRAVEIDLTDYSWMCCDCPEEMSTIDDLRTHHSEVHKQVPKYMCAECSKVFTHYMGFLSHYRRHLENDRYCTCETCGKCFSNKKALDSHRIIHSDKRPHVCNTCGKAFRQQSALYVHSRCHLPDELKNKYACDECDKRFSTKPNLVTHKRIHTGIRNYTCDQCGKSFVQKGNLDAHLLTHTTAKPFACQVCDKSFKTELQLRKHGSVHTGVKPHQCDICGRQFRERGTLREHHRIHTGAMPFSCEFCGKSFRFKGVLTTHRRQHTGERPYSCVECQHHFTNWPNYNKHMKRRHGINTSRQTRIPSTDNSSNQPVVESMPNSLPPQAPSQQTETDPLAHPMQLTHQQEQPPVSHEPSHQEHQVPLGPSSTPLPTVCDPQLQPTALIQKPSMETHQPQHLYHHESTLSQHSLQSHEDDSMSSHHELYQPVHTVHSPLSAHSAHAVRQTINLSSHLGHAGHPSHLHLGHDENEESKYATEREILLGQMVRDRDRPHFYNPAPGSSVNTNPYLHQSLHQSLHHSLQQTQLPLSGLYAIPQLSIDPSHLEILHSSASQHR